MSSSFHRSRRRVTRRSKDDDDTDYRSNASGDTQSSSLENIVYILAHMFGSCSSHLQTFFNSTNSPLKRHRREKTKNKGSYKADRSESTVTTEESSNHSKSNYNSKKLRSRSTGSLRHKQEHDLHMRRHRSLSKFDNSRTSSIPRREDTEIAVMKHDDDVSAISAHTLNEMHRKEIVRMLMMNQMKATTEEHFIEEAASRVSFISSETSDFPSIWKAKSIGSPLNSNADNYHSVYRREKHIDPHYRDDIRRHHSHFATIDEYSNDSLYVDEQEI